MATRRQSYDIATLPFVCQGQEQFVAVVDDRQTVRRFVRRSGAVVDETICPATRSGCAIEEIAASLSGNWLATQRYSGQGEWGYDVFRTCPLTRVAGVWEEDGYVLDVPRFSADETRLVGGFGRGWLGGWWAHPDDDRDEPVRGGIVSFGFLFVHHLPSHRVDRHELRIDLPKGWLPDDPHGEDWYGPRDITPTANGIRLMPSWGVAVEIEDPLPAVVVLPTPHPSGKGLM